MAVPEASASGSPTPVEVTSAPPRSPTPSTHQAPEPAKLIPEPVLQVSPAPVPTRVDSAMPLPRPKISLPANNETVNNAPEDPSHNVGVSHEGPEPLLRDPCVIPLYYRGIERRKNLQAEDLKRIFVRVTVEGYTSTWHFRPEEDDEVYVDSWKHFDPKRATRGEDGLPHVRIGTLALGGAELNDLDMAIGGKPLGGGVFGKRLVEKMRLTVDWEKGLARAEGCGVAGR